jgi:hypothetical protein
MRKSEIQWIGIALIIPSLLLYGAYIAGNRTNLTIINGKSENGTTGVVNELDGNYSFIVYGDMQAPLLTQMDRQKLVADRIAEEKNISVVIHTGDLVNDDNNRTEWNVADITEDNKVVTHVYPPNTIFETVVLKK